MNAFEFGYAVGQLEKSAFFPGAIGGTIGAVQAPSGSRLEGFGRGMVRDIGTQLGAGVGGSVGALGLGHLGGGIGQMLGGQKGRFAGEVLGRLGGLLTGGTYGGMKGYQGAGKLLGPASYQRPVAPAAASGKIEPNMLRLR